jgi:hypothetical protein
VLLEGIARWITKRDPQLLRLVLNSSQLRTQYDPAKFAALKTWGTRYV